MKILVAVKRVIDPYVKIRVKSDNSGVETQNIKMAMNPFDEIAIEEALRLREKNWATEVIAVSIGSDSSQETLRHALALGADKAILVRTEKSFESLNIAKILNNIVANEKPDLVLMGKQSIDGDNNQTPQMLAALLNWPQATNASKIIPDNNNLEVVREIDGGLETLNVQLPAVISTDLRLNEPRYASLPNIMKAKRKPLDIIDLDSLGLSLKQHVEILKVNAPATRSGGVILDSVAALLDKLQHEAKVL
ncbi:TPA: electron transfer flavoprotein subunit beta/FixA family protein [Legionella pneumophila]|uniref:electron transfer flavoprotein subunit beta/FixA family protein n=1 Tax=Legionella sp. PATHC039 TaxID=2992042 RepID=UPI0007782C04|nr:MULTISPECIES: electron transfer flavoprotein subunit beta/FixA family protein [Legionella]HAT8858840.1 electron transfer flavoprotein subunit beta/FixA family protein [Legionella pneumophila subsp. pneumophila]MCW8395446.1 electron transfer flavoprotein subunit beta/FixA family protein [Legionella sp. PATHC039]HAT7072092.1 electron transfer flavoprotein subunit beta/FixA family protein [Legionella pneumophila]HAT8642053.1 electron transfer flavoprotein subunit beta/FixA family protein [Legio